MTLVGRRKRIKIVVIEIFKKLEEKGINTNASLIKVFIITYI
jgi:hypothetical protein